MKIIVYGPANQEFRLRVLYAAPEAKATLECRKFWTLQEALLWVSENHPMAELSIMNLASNAWHTLRNGVR